MSVYITTLLLVSIASVIVDLIQHNRYLKNTKKHTFFFFLLSAIPLISVAGLRWKVGTDYGTYARIYLNNSGNFNIDLYEPGFDMLSLISSFISEDYFIMFFISSVLTIGLFVWTIYKYSDYYLLSVLLLVFIGAWHGSFNGIRQYLACAILFAGHRYILERDFWKYFLIVILASTFHISALVMILLYFVPRESITIKQSVILIVVIVLGLTGYEYIFNTIDSFLQASDRSVVAIGDYLIEELSIFRILVMVAPPTLYLFLAPKNVKSGEDHFYVNMLFLNAALYIITARSAYLARFTIYTNIYMTLGFPRIFKGTDKKTSAFIIYIAMILFSIFWGYEILSSDNLNNFQWIFER